MTEAPEDEAPQDREQRPPAASSNGSRPVRGLVLAGGGARGAYEAGVMTYIFQELPRELLEKGKIHVVCGTSVGAIHAAYLAATAQQPRRDIARIADLWCSLRIEKMLRLGPKSLFSLPREIGALFGPSDKAQGLLINSSHLIDVVRRNTPWERIGRNLREGHIDAVTVSATHISSGKTTVFLDRAEPGVPPWSRDPRIEVRKACLAPAHALASAAIPFLFPPVKIDGVYYSDGGVRQNTPLSPALRLGCDRVLVVALRHEESPQPARQDPDDEEPYPGAFQLLGKIVDALMLDRMEYDLMRLQGFNMILEEGAEAMGPTFMEQLNETAKKMRGANYRHIDTMIIRPSRDLGEMAGEFVGVLRQHLGAVSGWLFSRLAESDAFGDSDLLSYLLFDGRLGSALIELGRADADAARADLIRFFED